MKNLILALILALAFGCAEAPNSHRCPFVEIMEANELTPEACTPSCVGGSLGAENGYDGFGVFTCKVKGRVVEVHTDAPCYNSPDDYPMFDLNQGCPDVWGIKRWRP